MQQDFHAMVPKRTRVKFCGITNIADALAAEALGVDALGFVFYDKSARYIDFQTAASICHQLSPFILKVGLFVNARADYVKKALSQVDLDCLQFHGDESSSFCEQFKKPYYKAIAVQEDEVILRALKDYSSAKAILLDSFHEKEKGGTGAAFDWQLIPKHLTKPIILAGGLTPENVRQAIEKIHPYAVDVSSGIESSKGKKDINKMQAFMNEVYDAQTN